MNRNVGWFSPVTIGTIVIGIIVSYSIFYDARNEELRYIGEQFARVMDNRKLSLKREIDLHVEILHNISGLFMASQNVTLDEFKILTNPAMGRYPGIYALKWIPRVPFEQKRIYEKKAILDGHAGFKITEKNDKGQIVTVR